VHTVPIRASSTEGAPCARGAARAGSRREARRSS
jgi:hypothetical protein